MRQKTEIDDRTSIKIKIVDNTTASKKRGKSIDNYIKNEPSQNTIIVQDKGKNPKFG